MRQKVSVLSLLLLFAFTSPTFAQLDFGLDDGVVTESVDANPWAGSLAAGLNGKAGNSENLDINATFTADRETEFTKTSLLASYFYATNNVATVTNRFFGQARRERSFVRNPKFAAFYQAQYEWDSFKAFDYRLALHGGLSYEVYKLDDRFLKLRFGAGASREFGLPTSEWLPELQFGGDWERQLNDAFKLFATFDYYPNVTDFADFRFVTNAGLEFVLDAERNINFRAFVLDRFDSTPPPGNRDNDIDYGMAIVVGF